MRQINMRQINAGLASAVITFGAASVATPAYAADDMGSNPITELFDSFGMGDKEKPEIDYRERAALVPPATTSQLPPPAPKGSRSDAWPNDYDVMMRERKKAEAETLPTETNAYRMEKNSRLSPSELAGGRRTGGGAVTEPGGTVGDNTVSRLSPTELKTQRLNRDAIAQAESGPVGSRSRLSDPPPGYLAGNGVQAEIKPEQKPWYGRLFGN